MTLVEVEGRYVDNKQRKASGFYWQTFRDNKAYHFLSACKKSHLKFKFVTKM